MAKQVCLIPGDGIGPEVARAAREVLDAAGADIDWTVLDAGEACIDTYGTVMPEETLDTVREMGIALKGPITTPIGTGFQRANVQLRKSLDLYAAVRPVRTMHGIKTRYDDVAIVVVRENTEGLYSGIENEIVPGVVTSLKVATCTGCTRIAEFAFKYAKEREREKITVFHKANIMKLTDGLFLDCSREVRDTIGAGIEYEELIIDNGCMQMVRDPSRFDVLLLENLYGDMMSDLCAGLVGGLGVVPGANIGNDCAVFEAVHGSAPDLAGHNLANPLALIMSGAMMLNYLGDTETADRIRNAYDAVLEEGNPDEITRDIGGNAGTTDFTAAIIRRL